MAKESQKKYLETSIDYLVDYISTTYKTIYCSENYYKNILLNHALHQNVSLQCIVRNYMEALKDASLISGHKSTDILHVNVLLIFLRIYSQNEKTEEINSLFFHFRNSLSSTIPYLIGKSEGRIKSLMSLEAKIRNKIAAIEALETLLEDISNISSTMQTAYNHLQDEVSRLSDPKPTEIKKIKKFEEAINYFINNPPSMSDIKAVLIDSLEKNKSLNNIVKDIIGYRFIVYSMNKNNDENEMKDFLIDGFTSELKKFFWENGYAFDPNGFKNYISNPKDNNYSSLHYLFEIQDYYLEVQARTWKMHEIAENGEASHKMVYKESNMVYRFLQSFFTRGFDEQKKAQLALIGITEPLDISNRPWTFIPNEELPRTFYQIKKFEDQNIVITAVKNSP